MRQIAHIINPVIVDESSDLFFAQPITFETMKRAKEFAKEHVGVTLFSAQYPKDRSFVPEGLQVTPDLDRSVLDLGTFNKPRKLPLLKDILDRLYEESGADFLVYSNADIALMPYFYVSVNSIIDEGYDAFVINRRTISKRYNNVNQVYLMFAQAGEQHPGYDCFVFKRSLYPSFRLGSACIGANWIGRVLITNLICHSVKFRVFGDLHLTFHVGDDRNWKVPINSDYDKHNEAELYKILMEYKAKGLFHDRPLVDTFLKYIKDSKSDGQPQNDVERKLGLSLFGAMLKKRIRKIFCQDGN